MEHGEPVAEGCIYERHRNSICCHVELSYSICKDIWQWKNVWVSKMMLVIFLGGKRNCLLSQVK